MPEPRFRRCVAALQWRWLQERRLALSDRTRALYRAICKDAGSVRNAASVSTVGCKNVNESPEDERLAASEPRAVTLYTRPGCHLCEEAKALIEPMLGEFGVTLREVNIDEDAVLRQRYGTEIPLIFIGSRKAAKHRVDPVKFRRQLRDAI
jgi:glutaredoxin